ncbi:MAG: hypothetical protein ACR2KP_07470 [Egibacteraceae bacterium]
MQVSTEILEARDGEETLDWLFGRGAHAHAAPIPVVVVTSSQEREDIDAAYALGSSSSVSKASGERLGAHLQQVAAYWTRNSELPSSRAHRTS